MIIIRPGTSEDVAALAESRDMAADQLGEFVAWIDSHTETHLPYLAEIDGVAVGSAWLLVAERVPGGGSFSRRYGDVQAVFVREAYRNRGIGGALIAAILDEARARDLIHMTVHSGRRAVDFYLRAGFRHDRQTLCWDTADRPCTTASAH